jgi:hypothetical protein
MNENLFILADKLRNLRAEKDDQTAILKDISSEISSTESELISAMTDDDCPNFTRGEKQFVMTTKTYWSPEKDRKEALYSALKENGFEHLFSVNSQTLTSFVKEQVEENSNEENGETSLPDWLSGLVTSYENVGITMRPATKKSK